MEQRGRFHHGGLCCRPGPLLCPARSFFQQIPHDQGLFLKADGPAILPKGNQGSRTIDEKISELGPSPRNIPFAIFSARFCHLMIYSPQTFYPDDCFFGGDNHIIAAEGTLFNPDLEFTLGQPDSAIFFLFPDLTVFHKQNKLF